MVFESPSRLTRGVSAKFRIVAAVAFFAGGFTLPAVVLAVTFAPERADAAATYCMTSVPDSGTVSGVTFSNHINAWTDPNACPKDASSRQVAYDAFSQTNTAIYIDVNSVRAWLCGNTAGSSNPTAVTTTVVETWSSWSPANTCGFQADQSTYFGGVVNRWTYSNLDT